MTLAAKETALWHCMGAMETDRFKSVDLPAPRLIDMLEDLAGVENL